MTREKAKTLVSAYRHPMNRRRWAVKLSIGCQHFTIETNPLTKGEAGWYIDQLVTALTKL